MKTNQTVGEFFQGGSLPNGDDCLFLLTRSRRLAGFFKGWVIAKGSRQIREGAHPFSRHSRKQEFFGFHLLYRRRGRCSTPGPAVKTTQTGRSFYKPEAYRVSPLYHGGAAARLRQRSVQTSQWWRAFQGRGLLSLFLFQKICFLNITYVKYIYNTYVIC